MAFFTQWFLCSKIKITSRWNTQLTVLPTLLNTEFIFLVEIHFFSPVPLHALALEIVPDPVIIQNMVVLCAHNENELLLRFALKAGKQ